MQTLTLTVNLTDDQFTGLQWATNVGNKPTTPNGPAGTVQPSDYLTTQAINVCASYAQQRRDLLAQAGNKAFQTATPPVQAAVLTDLGIPLNYPTGNE